MRTPTNHADVLAFDDGYFERKARELVVADDEIEAWELDHQDLHGLADARDDLEFSVRA